MVRVEAQELEDVGEVPAFYIDRYEVTNRQFKEFVLAGGYREPKFWKHPFLRDGITVSWEQAMGEFVDSTGRPGPATWEAGDYPDGEENFPVGGISWFEAAAYAEFLGKELPTKDHWAVAAGFEMDQYWYGFPTLIYTLSNFSETGPRAVGQAGAMNAFGAFDMAGNVREWCFNDSGQGKHIRGGGWDDARRYQYGNESQLSPWDRSPKNGFRCAVYPGREKTPSVLYEKRVYETLRDPRDMEVVSDSVFEVYRAQFDYDKVELDAEVERRDDTPEDWIHEKVSFKAAYDGERVIVHLYLPKSSSAPYQSVIYFPGSNAVGGKPFFGDPPGEFGNVDYLVTNGRAVVYPVYKGTYERTGEMDIPRHWPAEEHKYAYTGYLVKWVQDLRRTIDFLETREDFRSDRIAFFGFSWGGINGGVIPAVEPRIRTVILCLGALHTSYALPEAHGVNYAPRITQPTLMLNGKYDAVLPLETHARPLFELLGTPDEHKKLIVYDSDHGIPKRERIKETLAWLDRYFGNVE